MKLNFNNLGLEEVPNLREFGTDIEDITFYNNRIKDIPEMYF